jgi:hypothetical protein
VVVMITKPVREKGQNMDDKETYVKKPKEQK